jgi:hypothetical protein
MISVKHLGIAVAICSTIGSAQAALTNTPVASNAYITFNNLDWAWAFPLPAAKGLDLSYQAQFGWRLPTEAELASAPLATNFIFAGANVPFGGSDPVTGANFVATNRDLTGAAACATPYFSNSYTHCDWQDGKGQPVALWAGTPGALFYADQLVVRVSAVPEPETYAMMIAGLGLMGYVARRRKTQA